MYDISALKKEKKISREKINNKSSETSIDQCTNVNKLLNKIQKGSWNLWI